MDNTYSPQPIPMSEHLTKPTSSYKRHAWLAVGGLALFVACYFLLSGWFVLTAYRLLAGAFSGGEDTFWGLLAGACAAFLAVFMLKALFFVKHGGKSEDIEITAKEQPRLFEFLYRLADEAGAPRPHRVFLSPRVNAAVFYDLSIFNLIYPSKKNLEIGLGLVNVLSLGEAKAVFAHEFGHFAQKTMAVGRWVYISQQIAAHIIAKRDALDGFLRGLSNFDIRVAWIGWILSLIVWSIRSLLETAFSLVILAQRALAREMEMQADLVAVSLTGSDALIHALHRLQAADEAWAITLGFVQSQLVKQRAVSDVFAIQSRLIEHIGVIRDSPDYGKPPALPERPEGHRLFKAEIAQPPRMWSTHPPNHEREENAKRIYIPAAVDDRPAWHLFDNHENLKEQVSAHLLNSKAAIQVPLEDSLKELDKQFEREFLNRSYRGVYLGRSIVLSSERPADLYGPSRETSVAELDSLYPEAIADDLEQLRNLEQEKALLESLRDGVLTAPDGVIRHRSREIKRQELPGVIASLQEEMAAITARVCEHDRLCRTAHRAAAISIGRGWEAHLMGLAEVLHFADHTEANIRDAQRFLANTLAVVTATGRVSSSGVDRVVSAAGNVYWALQQVFEQSGKVVLDTTLAGRLEVQGWKEVLEEFKLESPRSENIQSWIGVVDGWCDSAVNALSSLSQAALEQLLSSEATVARYFREGEAEEDAPSPAHAPTKYATLTPGNERELQTRLGWWARFQNADGIIPAIARFAVAGSIVGAVLGFGGTMGTASLTIYNGLSQPVRVTVAGDTSTVVPFSTVQLDLTPDKHYKVEARTADGQLIESFDGVPQGHFSKYFYNVASASPLVEWTMVYGNGRARPEQMLGAPRWGTSAAEVLFRTPPDSVRTKSGGATKQVLSGFGDRGPGEILSLLKEETERSRLIAAHARWDRANSAHILSWLGLAAELKEFPDIVASRLQAHPEEIVTLRAEQDAATGEKREVVCNKARALAQSSPNNADFQYLAMRCIKDPAERNEAFLKGRRDWPESGWLAYAAGYTLAGKQLWLKAHADLDFARQKESAVRNAVTVDLARIRRILAAGGPVDLSDLARDSDALRFLLAAETGEGVENKLMRAYAELAQGHFAKAVEVAGANEEMQAHLLRLVAASDGAPPELVKRALALSPDRGIGASTAWVAVALAARHNADLSPYTDHLKQIEKNDADAMLRFVNVLRAGDKRAAETAIDDLLPESRGKAYGIGVILLGKNAPPKWRETVKQLLFVPERPYFN